MLPLALPLSKARKLVPPVRFGHSIPYHVQFTVYPVGVLHVR